MIFVFRLGSRAFVETLLTIINTKIMFDTKIMFEFFKSKTALRNENEMLKNDVNFWQQKYEQQATMLGAARKDALTLRKENQALHATIDELQGSIEHLTDHNKELRSSNTELRKQLEELKAKQQPRAKNGRFKPKWNK